MKATDLINLLQQIVDEHGDMDVKPTWSHGSEPGDFGQPYVALHLQERTLMLPADWRQ